MDENKTSEQLEEGEIVDDGEYEDISDNSIIEPTFGKFVSSNENLRALSLSSDSESDVIRELRYKKKLLHRKSKVRHQRRRKKRRIATDTSDSDSSPPQDLKYKLKEAIHISGIEDGHRNTLESKLKAMGGLVANADPRSVSPEAPKTEPKAEESTDKMDDTELENLRMEALKTAVLNKFQRRKRKKAALEGKEEVTPLENKENDTPKDEQNNGEKVEINNAVIDIEEDEDVLRASLLAGLAKKIAKKTTPIIEGVIPAKPAAPKLPIKVVPALPKKLVNNFKNNKQIINKHVIQKVIRPKPQVKPLIINVNGDSDTEEDIKQKQAVPQVQRKKIDVLPQANVAPERIHNPALPKPQLKKIPDINAIQTNVEKFLKEQRAKFETEHQKKSNVVSKDKTLLEKSAVKLLPKSQQIEYQLLLKRLRTAEKRKRAFKQKLNSANVLKSTRNNHITVEVCPKRPTVEVTASSAQSASLPKIEVIVQSVVEKNEGNAAAAEKQEEASKSDSSFSGKVKSSKDSDSSERRLTNELTTLQKTLKEIKMQRNGSLQIKSKYQVLTPIIRKITETSNERKKNERRIKTLLQELNEARNCLSNSHERFSKLVRELVSQKEQIDKSCRVTNSGTKKKENGNIANENLECYQKELKSVPVTSTPIKAQIQNDAVEEATISTFVTSSTNNDCEDMDVCNSDETDICQIDIVDPNDIDQIFKRRPQTKSTIPEYVSPLNFNVYDRYRHVDPLGIMCPYEVNGSCRDIDCTYKHYLKNHERL